jgi:tRNA isopentenyltransferase (miaA)
MVDALIVTGPTASGKSQLAFELAKRLNGVIINSDSLQLYRELPLLTAQPTAQEQAEVPHYLYGTYSGLQPSCSVATWLSAAETLIEQAQSQQKLPIITGGTGFYLRALTQGLAAVPPSNPTLRAELTHELRQRGLTALYQELCAIDPAIGKTLNPQDTQRIMRALEVIKSTGQSLLHWQQQPTLPKYRYYTVLINPPRPEIIRRAETRLQKMMASGAIDEVKALLCQSTDLTAPIFKALGAKEIKLYLEEQLTYEAALEKTLIATRQYIKRQQTWFRHQVQADYHLHHLYPLPQKAESAEILNHIQQLLEL